MTDNGGPSQRAVLFKIPNPNQWLTRSDMLHWIQMQKYHDEHKDKPGHQCELCPLRMVFDVDENS